MASGANDSVGASTSGFCTGPWINQRSRYLGLKFMINGEVHYGWAQLSDTCLKGVGKYFGLGGENIAVLTGYAYETVPNQAIAAGSTGAGISAPPVRTPAPAPATLGLLAKGAPALSIWRPEQDFSK
jgi:hypothetical protein